MPPVSSGALLSVGSGSSVTGPVSEGDGDGSPVGVGVGLTTGVGLSDGLGEGEGLGDGDGVGLTLREGLGDGFSLLGVPTTVTGHAS